MQDANDQLRPSALFSDHRRDWKQNLYVYPVLSRRSRGLSIGINLNPDKACNFDCVYCQVDRRAAPLVRKVDPAVLEQELDELLDSAVNGSLLQDVRFGSVPPELQRINDIAFSGDGEPTTCPKFGAAVDLAIAMKQKHDLPEVKIVLITDACYLNQPQVSSALQRMDDHQGEIWAKLDAGTEDYYRRINKPNVPLSHVLDNITAAARIRPVVIQALFMRWDGQPPPTEEIEAFCGRLTDIVAGGGRIKLVQVYTIARPPAQAIVSALSSHELSVIANLIRERTSAEVERYGPA